MHCARKPTATEYGKPVARRGRKAAGALEASQLPKGRIGFPEDFKVRNRELCDKQAAVLLIFGAIRRD